MGKQIKTLHLDTVIKNHTQDMTGKVVLITGTTSGTGYICAREVAKQGAEVLLLNRESERSKQSYAQLQKEVPNGKFKVIPCDLQNFASVRNAIEDIKANYQKIYAIVNNAGVMALKDQPTVDGYDIQMQTNVLSHFLLTKELFSLLKTSEESRIVNHSSMARLGPPLEMKYFEKNGGNLGGDGTEKESLSFQGPRWQRYHQTKLANAVFTYDLKKKLDATGITNVLSLLAHPGLALTSLQITSAKDGGMDTQGEFMNNAQSAEDGATGIIRAVMDPKAKTGNFYGPTEGWKGFPDLLSPEDSLLDESNAKINWEGCEKAVGVFQI